jgi:hypothetical protein
VLLSPTLQLYIAPVRKPRSEEHKWRRGEEEEKRRTGEEKMRKEWSREKAEGREDIAGI